MVLMFSIKNLLFRRWQSMQHQDEAVFSFVKGEEEMLYVAHRSFHICRAKYKIFDLSMQYN